MCRGEQVDRASTFAWASSAGSATDTRTSTCATEFEQLIRLMVDADHELLSRGTALPR